MTVAEEAGDVRPETVESWNERAKEITRGWKAEDIGNIRTRREVFGVDLRKRVLVRREGAARVANKLAANHLGVFCQCIG